ncbi:unnamed protein product [Owenia fusiformis]|uniref:Uncharacterized protein n=1 Tax=Owenia fusiformis TaxID=6347 RepID=A0A8S4Q2T6_OWEFU|nr:unnamed protein product [Owenia fusiformis]
MDSINVKSLGKCGESCTTNSACFSFNFELGAKQKMSLCDLVFCSSDVNNSALAPNTTMTYYKHISEEATVATSPAIPLCNGCVHAPCQNGGTCTPTGPFDFTCQCMQGFSGATCEQRDGDCGGDPTYTGVRRIQTDEGRIFDAYCDQGWTYVFNRFDGSVDFYRNWVEFQQGFGNVSLEHFIGLDNLVSVLKQRSYKVRFDLTPWPSSNLNPPTGFAEYSTFNLADESDKYRINIGGYSGTAGDAMASQNGQRFTTYDQDNDPYGSNCAVTFKGAWWHAACHNSNLFATYEQGPTCHAFAACVCWKNYPGAGHGYSFNRAVMKLHRV